MQVFPDPVNPVLMKKILREDIDGNGYVRQQNKVLHVNSPDQRVMINLS